MRSTISQGLQKKYSKGEIMTTRLSIYFNEETSQKFSEIKMYLENVGGGLGRQSRNQSAVAVLMMDTFYKLFIEMGEGKNYHERLSQLEKNFAETDETVLLKSMRRQLDQLLYLELTNFHAITKGSSFDIQDLESIHSRFDPKQNELLARINDVIQEDTARGQTIKHSH